MENLIKEKEALIKKLKALRVKANKLSKEYLDESDKIENDPKFLEDEEGYKKKAELLVEDSVHVISEKLDNIKL